MTQNDLLGVCIPTYKRPEQLERTVRSVIRSGREHGIPIYITDDSCDGTNDNVISKLQQEYSFIHHVRNPNNLGIDGNIRRCAEVCTSRYAWILGEDDRLVSGAVSTMLACLEKTGSSFPYYYVNYVSVDEDVSFVLHERSLQLDGDNAMPTAEFYARHAWSMGFLGACVVDAERWRSTSPEPYLGTWYAHVGVIMEMCREGEVYLVAEPLVLNRCGTPRTFTWTGSAFDVLGGWKKLADMLEPQFGKETCNASVASYQAAHGTNSVKLLCYLRADGAFGFSKLRTVFEQRQPGLVYRIGAILAAAAPPFIFKMIRWMIMSARRKSARRIKDPGDAGA